MARKPIKTKSEQTRKPTLVLLNTLKDFGADAFPKKHPEYECVLVPRRDKANGPWQKFSDVPYYKKMGYEILSEDIEDTEDDEFVWMGMPKDKFDEQRRRQTQDLGTPEMNAVYSVTKVNKGLTIEDLSEVRVPRQRSADDDINALLGDYSESFIESITEDFAGN